MLPERIDTERLILHAWREHDAEDLRRALDANDAHLRPWIPFMQHEPMSLAETGVRLRERIDSFRCGEHFRYAIRERLPDGAAGGLVGETMLLLRGGPGARELGYWLQREHCGKGYATEAARPLVQLAFDVLGAQRVVLRCDERNVASLAVARRLGARAVGLEDLVEGGVAVRLIVFECLPDQRAARDACVRRAPAASISTFRSGRRCRSRSPRRTD